MVYTPIAGGDIIRLTGASVGEIAVLSCLAILAGVGTVGWAVH